MIIYRIIYQLIVLVCLTSLKRVYFIHDRSVLAPHAEQILQQLESLLPLDPAPEHPASKGANGSSKPSIDRSGEGTFSHSLG